MPSPLIESWSTLHRFTPGRRGFCGRKLQAALLAAGYPDLAARCEPIIEAELKQFELLRAFRVSQGLSTASWTPEIIAADQLLDRLIGDLFELLTALARRVGTRRGDAAKTLVDAGFSEGLAYYTQQIFSEEEIRVASLLALLARHPDEVELTTAEDIVAEVTAAHLNYQTLLVAHEKAERMRFDAVKATDLANQRQFIELIIAILARTGELPEAERLTARGQILASVIEHDEAIGALLSARRRVKDVHPDSGEPEA